jgi:glycosyltransferase involved in cell wall biosynthesis
LQAHGALPKIISRKEVKWLYDVFFGSKLIRDSSKVIALTKFEAQQYRALGVPETKIEIVPNGVDLREYSHLPARGSFKKKFKIDEDDKVVLYVGRINKIKGIEILVKAFSKIIKDLANVKLAIVGPEDGYLGEIKALVKELKIEDKVLILDALYGKEKLEAYVDSEFCVVPSRYETFPMTILEAYACGKPVISSNVGGLRDLVIHGNTGLLFESENENELAKDIQYLLVNARKKTEFGVNSQKFVYEKYTIDKSMSTLNTVYSKILSETNRA